MKTEPATYSIDDLRREDKTAWEGVRNFQARNFMRDEMRSGDLVLIYHSNCDEPGVYGLGKVASEAYPDPTQFDRKSGYFDPRATREKPVWQLVDIAFVKKFARPVPLSAMRAERSLSKMMMLRPGSRLSVTPVEKKEFDRIVAMAGH